MTILRNLGHIEFSHDFALRSILAGSPSSIITLVTDIIISTDQNYLKTILHWCNFASNLFDCPLRVMLKGVNEGSQVQKFSCIVLLMYPCVSRYVPANVLATVSLLYQTASKLTGVLYNYVKLITVVTSASTKYLLSQDLGPSKPIFTFGNPWY